MQDGACVILNSWNNTPGWETRKAHAQGRLFDLTPFPASPLCVTAEMAKRDISARYTLESILESNLGHNAQPCSALVEATVSFIK